MWSGCNLISSVQWGICILSLTSMVRLRPRQTNAVRYGIRISSVRSPTSVGKVKKAAILRSIRFDERQSESWISERSVRWFFTMTSVFIYTKSKLHNDFWTKIRLPKRPSAGGHLWCIRWRSLPTGYGWRGSISPLRICQWTKLPILEREQCFPVASFYVLVTLPGQPALLTSLLSLSLETVDSQSAHEQTLHPWGVERAHQRRN